MMLSDWSRAPSSQHQFEKSSELVKIIKMIKSEIVLNDYINHMKMELYGRGETMIQVGAGSEGEDGDG